MNCVDVNKRWNGTCGEVDFPYDFLTEQHRDYRIEGGADNSYYPPVCFSLSRTIPLKKAHKHILEIDGACGNVDLYVDDVLIETATDRAKRFYEIGGTHAAAVRLDVTAGQADRYTGAGIAGGVKLFTAETPVYIPPYGVSVETEKLEEKATVLVSVEITNDSDYVQKPNLEAVVLNARGKRVGRRLKKVKLQPRTTKTFTVPVRVSRYYLWSLADPYLYTCAVSVLDAKVLDSASVKFGIRTLDFDGKGFLLNGKPVFLRGGTVCADNGILGAAAYPTAERRKFAALKDAGYNAVRVSRPTEATVAALDELGLLAVVDLLDVWKQPKDPRDRHVFFERDAVRSVVSTAKAYKSSPAIVAYSLGDNLPESYGRGDISVADKLIAALKMTDPTRLVCASIGELVPTDREVQAAGGKSGMDARERIGFGREKDLFRRLSAPFVEKFDFIGYNNLSHRYAVDKLTTGRAMLGTGSSPKRVFDAYEDAEKNGAIGDLAACAVDGLGTLGLPDKKEDMRPRRSTACGDFDGTLRRKPISYYREIVFGVKPRSYIVVTPEDEVTEQGEWDAIQGAPVWNWPRHVGKPVIVQVFTSGEVVALYLDGKLVGRKLAGKINGHIATFKINYYPGKLEAVSFRRGFEHDRTSIETVSSPKCIRLSATDKTAHLDGDGLCFIDVAVCDVDGRPVAFAQREINVEVLGDGKRVAVGNGDPYSVTSPKSETVEVYEGRAVIVVKGLREGKIVVKATSDGLTAGRLTVKVR